MMQSNRNICVKVESKIKNLLDVFIDKQGFSFIYIVRISYKDFFEGRGFL
jgi:hypothetical protein